MDVGDPSNLERIRWLFNGDVDALRAVVRGAWVSDADTTACIARVAARTGYVLDPHAAVGWQAMERLRDASASEPWVVLATAHPCKFPDVVREATGANVQVPVTLASRLSGPEHVEYVRADAGALRALLLRGIG
jgi:threonine synthase